MFRPTLLVALACVLACTDGKLRETVRVLAPSTSEVDFGDTYVGGTGRRTLSLTNLGTGWVEVHALAIEGDAAFSGPAAPLRLAPGQKMEVAFTFDPAEPGPAEATLRIASDAENAAEIAIALHGRGVEAPSCDDGNACTTDAFDAAAGACTHAPRAGPCDDGSACTTEGVCEDGVCRGLAVACDDHDPCTRDVCDAATGCLALPDETACRDDNPCTLDLCDREGGCKHTAAPDGTGCGPLEGCRAFHVCVGGACRALAVPDGTPCSDGDFCTTGDTCEAGTCRGTRARAAPALVTWAPSFGGEHAVSAWLDDSHIVVIDAGQYTGSEPVPSQQLSIVRVAAGRLELVSSTAIAGLPPVTAVAAPWVDRIVTIHAGELRVFYLPVSGAPVARGRATLVGPTTTVSTATAGGAVYLLHDQRLDVVDLTDADAPVVKQLPAPPDVGHLAHDATHRQLLATSAGGGILRYDTTNPNAPTPLPAVACNACGALAAAPEGIAVFEGANTGAGRLRIYRELGQAPVTEVGFAANEGISAVDFTPSGLVAARITNEDARILTDLLLYDLATPARPRLAGTFALFGSGGYPGTFSARGNDVLLLPRMLVFEAAAASGQPFRPLTGAAHGNVELVAGDGTDVLAYSSHGTNLLRGGRFVQGAQTVGAAGFVRFGAPGQAPAYPAMTMSEDPAITWVTPGTSFVLDATSTSAPVVDGSWSLGGLHQFGVARGDGRYVYALSTTMFGHVTPTLGIYDLGSGPARFDAEIPPLAAVDLPAMDVSVGNMAIGLDGRRVAASVSLQNGRTHLALFDVSSPAAPVLVASTEIVGRIGSVAVAGEVVVAVASPANLAWGFGADTIVVFEHAATASGLVERGRLPLSRAGHVLAFDGHTAVIARPHSAEYVSVDTVPAASLGTVDLPADPRAAALVGDQLLIAAGRGLAVLDPPCPPPP